MAAIGGGYIVTYGTFRPSQVVYSTMGGAVTFVAAFDAFGIALPLAMRYVVAAVGAATGFWLVQRLSRR